MTTRAQSLASPGNAWPAGHRLGPYELLETVSSRSGAIVYRGWDHTLQRPVAVKEYLPARLARRNALGGVQPAGADEADAFERGRRAFIEEARQLGRCDHPALLRVVALLELHGTAYRVMPWLAGTPLAELRQGMAGPPDEAALRRLAEELLGALESWHAAVGQPHGGVEPAQVLLLEDDRAMLLGPGLPRRETASDAVEALMRQLEPAWAAPEQAEPSANRPQGPWTDFHALAHTLRFALTGLPPPPAGAPRAAPLAQTVERLFPGDPAARYGHGLLQVLDLAAAADPRVRPQTAQQLRDLLAGEPWVPPAPPMPAPPEADPVAAPPGDLAEPVVPPPAEPPAEPPAPTMADDETTAQLIRSVIASIPDAPPRVPMPPPPAAVAAPTAPVAALPDDFVLPGAEPPATAAPAFRPRRPRLAVTGAAVLLVAGAAVGWQAWQARQAPAELHLPAPVALPPAAAPASLPSQPPSQPPSPLPDPLPAPPPVAPVAETPAPPPAPVAEAPAPPPAPAPEPSPPPPVRTARPSTPRELCGPRSDFALYRCFQQQCAKAAWARHPQCQAFKRTDHVPS